jgi:hypothetical protein
MEVEVLKELKLSHSRIMILAAECQLHACIRVLLPLDLLSYPHTVHSVSVNG